MGLTINKAFNGIEALKKLGVPAEDIEWFEGIGGQVKATASAIELKYLISVFTIKMDVDALIKLAKGTLPSYALSELSIKAAEAVSSMKAAVKKMPPTAKPTLAQVGALGALPTSSVPLVIMEPATGKVSYAEPPKWPAFDQKQMKTAKPVKLRDAKAMYQPVMGTSPGSRYFMVAASEDLRVAARYHGSTLSLRVEGPGFDKHVSAFGEAGFSTIDKGKGYASIHLEVGVNVTVANKTLGALLLGLGLPLETPIPNVKMIHGMGG